MSEPATLRANLRDLRVGCLCIIEAQALFVSNQIIRLLPNRDAVAYPRADRDSCKAVSEKFER